LENNNAKMQRRDGAKNKSLRVYFTGIFGCAIEQYELKVNNAPLTGESRAVRRTADPAFEDEFVENPNLVFGGTMVAAGSGKAVVFATGASTEFGKIVSASN